MHHLTTSFSSYNTAYRRVLRLSVRLGSPRSGDCSSVGICSMQPLGYVPDTDCAAVVEAYLRLDRPTGRLLLHFSNDSINDTIRAQHFADGRFTVADSYRLPSWVVRELELPAAVCRIAPGRYPVLADDCFTTLSAGLTTAAVVVGMRGRLLAA